MPSSAEARPTRRRLSSEERQSEIIRVAVELAASKGVEQVTTQDIADAMQLTQGAVFRHFSAKDEIWFAVIVWVREHLMRVIDRAAAGAPDPLMAIEQMFSAHLKFVGRHPAIPRLLFSELLHKKSGRFRQLIEEIIGGYEDRIVKLIDEAKACALIDQRLCSRAAAVLYIGMVQGLVLRSAIVGGGKAAQPSAAQIFQVFLRSLTARP